MDRWKAEQGRGREKRKIRRKKSRRERVSRKKMQMREKVGKSRNTMFFQWFVAPEGRKSRLAKAAGAEPAGQMRDCTPLWREAHFQVKCTKHTIVGPLLEVGMSKKCTPLWREAHFQVKMYKTHHGFGPFLEVASVEKVHAVVARSTFRSQNVQNTPCSDHFWAGSDVASRGRRKGLCTLSKVSKTWGFCSIFNYNHHYTTLHSNTLHYTTTTTTPSLHSTTLHSNYTTLHSTLHSITLHYTTLHYTTLHSTTLHYTTLHHTTLQTYTEIHYTPQTEIDR